MPGRKLLRQSARIPYKTPRWGARMLALADRGSEFLSWSETTGRHNIRLSFFTASAQGSESSYARYGVILPFDRAIQEFYTQAKAPSPIFAPGINHCSYLRKLTSQGGNQRFFARPPGPLADYASTLGTDVFRNRSLTGAGFSQACEVDWN